MTDDDAIAEYLRRKGVTKCPPACARIIGESRPGFMRIPGTIMRRKEFDAWQDDLKARLLPWKRLRLVELP